MRLYALVEVGDREAIDVSDAPTPAGARARGTANGFSAARLCAAFHDPVIFAAVAVELGSVVR